MVDWFSTDSVGSSIAKDVRWVGNHATLRNQRRERPMDQPDQVTIRQPNEGRTIGIVGDIYRVLTTGEETNGRYAMFEAIVLPGGGPPAPSRMRACCSPRSGGTAASIIRARPGPWNRPSPRRRGRSSPRASRSCYPASPMSGIVAGTSTWVRSSTRAW